MIAFIRKFWRRRQAKAADKRAYLDQTRRPGHTVEDAERKFRTERR